MAKTEKASSRKPTIKEKYVAYHEAGHAAVGHLLGIEVKFVSSDVVAHPPPEVITDGTAGICCYGETVELPQDYPWIALVKDFIGYSVGHYAGKRGAPNGRPGIRTLDHADFQPRQFLFKLAEDWGIDRSSTRVVEQFLMIVTKIVLEKSWPEIELVANALLEKKFLTKEEVKAILPKSPDPEIYGIANEATKTAMFMLTIMRERNLPQRAEKAVV
ncbi:MAG TPA: hypothetical protein PK123_07130 [Bacteroidales bacterium]|nr:hypothetical protein [Bacteroidales bacterium]HQN24671.1 hypothetical protein [Bacteroidales bacterium]